MHLSTLQDHLERLFSKSRIISLSSKLLHANGTHWRSELKKQNLIVRDNALITTGNASDFWTHRLSVNSNKRMFDKTWLFWIWRCGYREVDRADKHVYQPHCQSIILRLMGNNYIVNWEWSYDKYDIMQ